MAGTRNQLRRGNDSLDASDSSDSSDSDCFEESGMSFRSKIWDKKGKTESTEDPEQALRKEHEMVQSKLKRLEKETNKLMDRKAKHKEWVKLLMAEEANMIDGAKEFEIEVQESNQIKKRDLMTLEREKKSIEDDEEQLKKMRSLLESEKLKFGDPRNKSAELVTAIESLAADLNQIAKIVTRTLQPNEFSSRM